MIDLKPLPLRPFAMAQDGRGERYAVLLDGQYIGEVEKWRFACHSRKHGLIKSRKHIRWRAVGDRLLGIGVRNTRFEIVEELVEAARRGCASGIEWEESRICLL